METMKIAKQKRHVALKRTINTISILEVIFSSILGRERIKRMFLFRLAETDYYEVETEEIKVKKGKIRYTLHILYYKNHSEKVIFDRHE